MAGDKQIFLVSRRRTPATRIRGADDLYDVGTLATVLQLLKLPDGTVKVLVEGQSRAQPRRRCDAERRRISSGEAGPRSRRRSGDTTLMEGLVRSAAKQFEAYVKLNKKTAPEIAVQIGQIEDAGRFADTIAANLTLKIADKQSLLAQFDIAKRLEAVFGFMEGEMGVLQVEKKIRSRVKRQMEKTQREYYLNEQMKAIQRELGEGDEPKDETSRDRGEDRADQAVARKRARRSSASSRSSRR